MEYRRMGKTGLQLSVLSYGSWVTFSKQVDDSASDRLMGLAYDNGINFFDNAEAYEGGRSEEMMGRVLSKKNWDRTTYCVSSKAFFGLYGKNNKPNQHGLSRKHLTEACHAALRRMQVDYLDLFYCHRPDRDTPMEEIVWTMNILLQQGKILYWGTSEWTAAEIMEAHAVAKGLGLIGPAMEQPQYNMLERQKRIDRLFGKALPKGMLTFYKPAGDICCKISEREAIICKLAELDPEGKFQWIIVIDNILSVMPSAATKNGYDKIKPWFEALKALQADILVCHEAPGSHRHGFSVIGDLAAAMGVKRIYHGHLHENYTRTIKNNINVFGVADKEVIDLSGNKLSDMRTSSHLKF